MHRRPHHVEALWTAVETFDDALFDDALTRILDEQPLDVAVTGVVLPFLQELGDGWESGSLSVAHEHFASNLLSHRLGALTLASTLDVEQPVAVLACPPQERHDLVLLCFALLLARRGWRTRFLGADTPMAAIALAARSGRADAVVVASTRSLRLEAHAASLRRLGADHPVFLGGRGATSAVAQLCGAQVLPSDPVVAVQLLADLVDPASSAAG